MSAMMAKCVWALVFAPMWVCSIAMASGTLQEQTPGGVPQAGTPQIGTPQAVTPQPDTPPQTSPSSGEPVRPAAATTPLEGSALFHERGCEYCHGANAAGTTKGPSLLSVGRRLRPSAIEHQIHEGGGGMPAFGTALSQPEIDALVKYLTRKKAPVKKPRATPKAAGTAVSR